MQRGCSKAYSSPLYLGTASQPKHLCWPILLYITSIRMDGAVGLRVEIVRLYVGLNERCDCLISS
jgi:hypothetical protein